MAFYDVWGPLKSYTDRGECLWAIIFFNLSLVLKNWFSFLWDVENYQVIKIFATILKSSKRFEFLHLFTEKEKFGINKLVKQKKSGWFRIKFFLGQKVCKKKSIQWNLRHIARNRSFRLQNVLFFITKKMLQFLKCFFFVSIMSESGH